MPASTDPRDRLRGASPGQRWVVRTRLADGSATDLVGWVAASGPDGVTLAGPLDPGAPDDSPAPAWPVPYASVLAARRAPAAAGGPDPRRTSAADLERVALPAWAGTLEPFGEWTLRHAGGFSGRANSCLAVGDPGVPVEAAAARIVTHARAHGIAPLAQVVVGSAPDEALRVLGWAPTDVGTDVLAARLADLLDGREPDPRVVVRQNLSPAWRAAFDQSRPSRIDPGVVSTVLDGRPPRAYAEVQADGQVVALARAHLGGPWLGLAAIWTRPDHRRHGLATALVTSVGHWAARRSARWCYLQVGTDNLPAQRAYAALGYVWHHRYHYLAPPGSDQPARLG